MITERKPFFKINFEDLELAKEFFENPKHYSEWLYAISEYYQGNLIEIKTKIVLKYFNNYKKTMDFILKSKEFGKKSQLKQAENKYVTDSTLTGVLEVPFKEPSQLNINDKVLIIKHKVLININERKLKFADTLNAFLPVYGKDLLNNFFLYWTEPNKSNTKMRFELERTWENERRLITWSNNEKTFKTKNNGKPNNTPQGREDALRNWGQRALEISNRSRDENK